VFEEKLSDRRDYLDLIAQTKGNNDDLYKKMVQTGEKRGDAFFKTEDNQNNLKEHDTTRDIQPLRRTKSNRNRKNSHKTNTNSKIHENDILNEIEHDEEMVALTWAYKILKTELHRRYEIRDKNKLVSNNSRKKMQAYLRFKEELKMRTRDPEDEEDGEGKYKDVIKNVTSANSIVNFMKSSINSADKPKENEDLPPNEEESGVLNNQESSNIKVNEKKDFTTAQTFVAAKDQIDDAQKIIDKVMPKNNGRRESVVEECCIQTNSKGGLLPLKDGGAIDASSTALNGFQEKGKVVFK